MKSSMTKRALQQNTSFTTSKLQCAGTVVHENSTSVVPLSRVIPPFLVEIVVDLHPRLVVREHSDHRPRTTRIIVFTLFADGELFGTGNKTWFAITGLVPHPHVCRATGTETEVVCLDPGDG